MVLYAQMARPLALTSVLDRQEDNAIKAFVARA